MEKSDTVRYRVFDVIIDSSLVSGQALEYAQTSGFITKMLEVSPTEKFGDLVWLKYTVTVRPMYAFGLCMSHYNKWPIFTASDYDLSTKVVPRFRLLE